MTFALQNKLGLFLQTMGNARTDHSFTKDENEALVFNNETDAMVRRNKLAAFNLKVVPFIKNKVAAQHLIIHSFWVTYLLRLCSS